MWRMIIGLALSVLLILPSSSSAKDRRGTVVITPVIGISHLATDNFDQGEGGFASGISAEYLISDRTSVGLRLFRVTPFDGSKSPFSNYFSERDTSNPLSLGIFAKRYFPTSADEDVYVSLGVNWAEFREREAILRPFSDNYWRATTMNALALDAGGGVYQHLCSSVRLNINANVLYIFSEGNRMRPFTHTAHDNRLLFFINLGFSFWIPTN